MNAFGVVIHSDVFKDLCLSILDVFKSAPFEQCCFKAAKTAFHEGIVIRVIGPAHAWDDFSFHEQCSKGTSGVLDASVGMNKQALTNCCA